MSPQIKGLHPGQNFHQQQPMQQQQPQQPPPTLSSKMKNKRPRSTAGEPPKRLKMAAAPKQEVWSEEEQGGDSPIFKGLFFAESTSTISCNGGFGEYKMYGGARRTQRKGKREEFEGEQGI